MLAAAKAVLYLGTVLLAGAGLSRFYLFEGLPQTPTRFRLLSLTGVLCVIGTSLYLLIQTPTSLLGFWDTAFIWDYTLSSREGRWVVARTVATLCLFGLLFLNRSRLVRAGFILCLATIAASFALLSHAQANGFIAVLADSLHGFFAALWMGGVLMVTLSPLWHVKDSTALTRAVKRLSKVAQLSVLVLLLSGSFAVFKQLDTLLGLLGSRYGAFLGTKLMLFVYVMSAAAYSHFHYLPRLRASGQYAGFRQALWIELIFLVILIGVTGALTVTEPP